MRIIITYIIIAVNLVSSYAQDMETIIDLSGKWSFSIGDNMEWAHENFNDDEWNTIYVPDSWEDQGYHGYDGIAWYRKGFNILSSVANQNLYLELGYIDDVDEVYINGYLVGSTGSFPPNYKTAYNAKRLYYVPTHMLKENDENIIAIRVFDERLEGGILRGDIRLLKEKNPLILDIDLQGYWKFKKGDNEKWSNLTDYSNWEEIRVPGTWENQGYYNYDGFAWYVIQIIPKEEITKKDLILVLGKIDDIDELYINGEFIAGTGRFKDNYKEIHVSYEYNEFRGYYLPENILKPNEINTIAVRVFDARLQGGIYKGPIGIISQEKYIQYWRDKKRSR